MPVFFQSTWLVEATWEPSDYYLQGNAQQAARMDFYAAEKYWFYNVRAGWEWILHKNPNVGVNAGGLGMLFGADAAA